VSSVNPSRRGSLRPHTGQVRSLESVVKPHPEHCLITAFLTTSDLARRRRRLPQSCVRGNRTKLAAGHPTRKTSTGLVRRPGDDRLSGRGAC
jgi:hypothetical protein